MLLYQLILLSKSPIDSSDASKHAEDLSKYIRFLDKAPFRGNVAETIKAIEISKTEDGLAAINILLELHYAKISDIVSHLEVNVDSIVKRLAYNTFELEKKEEIENIIGRYTLVSSRRLSVTKDEIDLFEENFQLVGRTGKIHKLEFAKEVQDGKTSLEQLEEWFADFVENSYSSSYTPPLDLFSIHKVETDEEGAKLNKFNFDKSLFVFDKNSKRILCEVSNYFTLLNFIEQVLPASVEFYRQLDYFKENESLDFQLD